MKNMEECQNCGKENTKSGYVDSWDGVCPDCGRVVNRKEYNKMMRPWNLPKGKLK
jgi:predicted RNA-binding Zn-ribbon protein involved in translation (DUF1610 family)